MGYVSILVCYDNSKNFKIFFQLSPKKLQDFFANPPKKYAIRIFVAYCVSIRDAQTQISVLPYIAYVWYSICIQHTSIHIPYIHR